MTAKSLSTDGTEGELAKNQATIATTIATITEIIIDHFHIITIIIQG